MSNLNVIRSKVILESHEIVNLNRIKKLAMINSQLNHFTAFGGEDMSFPEFKIEAINYSPTEIKPTRFSSKSNSTPGSNSSSQNNNNSNTDVKNGIVDAGKLLLEAAKTGDTDKVNECIRNGAPFITDWVSFWRSY